MDSDPKRFPMLFIVETAIFLILSIEICHLLVAFSTGFNHLNSQFDITVLETNIEDRSTKIQMIKAQVLDSVSDQESEVKDEIGRVWNVPIKLSNNDTLLLWIDTMNTRDLTDDEIITVWKEVG